MTGPGPSGTEGGSDAGAEVRRLFSGALPTSDLDVDDVPYATYWPAISPDDAPEAWNDLRDWVTRLRHRFPLDHHVVPPCWYEHNEIVEALVALKDHEAASYADTAPATAPLEWLRALRDVTTLLRGWTADSGCGATHQVRSTRLFEGNVENWTEFVDRDVELRGNGSLERRQD